MGLAPWNYPGSTPWDRYDDEGDGYWQPYPDPHCDDEHSDSDAAMLGAVLGAGAIVSTALVERCGAESASTLGRSPSWA